MSTLLSSVFVARSQVSVKFTNKENSPIDKITVELLRSRDSVTVKTAITDKAGNAGFENLKEGAYLVKGTLVNYKPAYSTIFTIVKDQVLSLPQMIIVAKEPTELKAVTVFSKKQFIEVNADKTIVNVDASPTNAGATALEVLEKSPGVTVSNDGLLSLRGKNSVLVLVDGKSSYLSAADLSNYLKNMPASAIDQIEIMTNPSAKYDAEGNAGVINIKTKKGRASGLNGSVIFGITTGFYEDRKGTMYVTTRFPPSFLFNYRKNKINIYGNYNPLYARRKTNLLYVRTKLDPSKIVTGFNETLSDFNRHVTTHSLKLGLDLFADKKNTYGIVFTGTSNSRLLDQTSYTTISDQNRQLLSVMDTKAGNDIFLNDLAANFNYRHVFDSIGKELTIDADYVLYDNVSKTRLFTDFYNNAGQSSGIPLLLNGVLPAKINIYSLKANYILPLKSAVKIETGIKSSLVKNDNLVDYTRWNGNAWVKDSRSNHFMYDENINALYLNGSKQFKKWNLQVGLRLENTNANGYQVTNDSSFKRNFTNLFPTAFVSYAVNKEHSFTLAAGRRITRPNYQDLNPFLNFLDSISFQVGNPFLLPQLTNNAELSYSYKGRLTATLNYSKTKNVFSVLLTTDNNVVYLQPRNLAGYSNFGLSVITNFPVAKKWNSNIFLNLFNNRYKGIFNNSLVDMAFTQLIVNCSETYTIQPGFVLELSGVCRTKGVDQLVISHPQWWLNVGLQKQVMKGKGTFRFNIRDLFWTQKFRGYQDYELVRTTIENTPDSRQVSATLTYRFGKGNQQNQQGKKNAAPLDEQNRAGQ